MAIAATTYALLRQLARMPDAKRYPQLLQFGYAEWYGDESPEVMLADLDLLPGGRRDTARLLIPRSDQFELADWAYMITLGMDGRPTAIDMDPSAPGALPLDLSQPIDLGKQFDVVVNSGTLEHVANDTEGFRTAHNHCAVGGLMIHEAPFTGWVDHGFRNYQPTWFYSLADFNKYELVLVACEHLASRSYFLLESREDMCRLAKQGRLANNLMLFVAMRKTVDAPFVVPTKEVYAGTLIEERSHAWRELR